MITTLLLQTLMASDPSAALRTARGGVDNTVAAVATTAATAIGIPTEKTQELVDTAQKAMETAKKATEAATAALQGQSWRTMLFGSAPRILWTSLNAATILAAGGMTAYLQFAPHNADSSTAAPGVNGTTAAPSYYDRTAGFYESLDSSDQRVMQATTATWVLGIVSGLVQYCVTTTNDVKEAVQSGPFETGAIGSEPTAAVDFFNNVKQVVVGESDSAPKKTMPVEEFKRREGYDANNPYAKDAYYVILQDGTMVQITEEGQRQDQLPSASTN